MRKFITMSFRICLSGIAMNFRRLYLAFLTASLIGFLVPVHLHAQKFANSVNWRIFLQGLDNENPSTTPIVAIGLHPLAHNPIPPTDTMHSFTDRWFENFTVANDTEWAQQPPPPPGSYWLLSNLRQPIVGQYKVMIHQFTDSTMIDTMSVKWASDALANGDAVNQTWRWPSPAVLRYYADSIFLTDITGNRLRINLTKDSVYNYNSAIDTIPGLTDPPVPISTSSLRLLIFHPKRPPLPPDSVISTYPLNGAPGMAQSDSLKWQATPTLPGMTVYYRVQLANDRSFSAASIVLKDSIAATSRAYTGLTPSKWYYWRVKAFAPFGVGIYKTVIDSFFVGVPTPKINLVSPTKGQLNVSDTARLVWKRFPYGTMSYRVQLSALPTFSTLIGDSTLTDSSVIFPTVLADCDTFYWRVHGINEAGNGPDTASFFRSHFGVPGPLTALRLPDGAVNVPTASIRFAWVGKDQCTDSYRIQVATDSNFANLFVNALAADTFSVATNFSGQTTYYWHVRAENTSQQGAYTTRRSFTTLLIPPGTPVLVSPANGATVAVTGSLVWNKAANNPSSYRIELSTDPQVRAPWIIVDSTLTDTSKPFGPLVGCSTYYWHVLAMNDSGKSAFTAIRSFTTAQTIPDTVRLISPADGATNQPQLTQLQWAPTGICPTTSYILHVALDVAFTNIVLRETLSVTSTTYGPLITNQKYYWRIYPVNNTGMGLAVSRSFTATALTKPGAPRLISPPDGQAGTPLSPTLMWDTTARAASWRLQVAYDTGFTKMIVNDSTLTKPFRQVGPLLDSTWFYWRVNAKNDSGTSPFARYFSFYTLGPPTMPYLVKPLNAQTDVPVVPTFYWTLPSGAATFQLQVTLDSLFTNFVFNDSTITTTTYTLNIWLKGYTRYFWRLRAMNGAGWSPFTAAWSFRTARVGAADWFLPLAIAETGPQHDTIYFGVNSLATYGIDPSIGELELPQPPPPGNFDFRFIDIPSRPGLLGQGLRLNILPFIAYTQVDSFRVRFQPGVGTYPMILSWPQKFIQSICDSMVIMDEFGGNTVHKRMDIDSSVAVVNTGLSTLIIVEYGAFPTGVRKESPLAPRGFVLSQNYPNPFNPTTQIHFSTDHAAHIDLKVYDVLGREIVTLLSNNVSPGEYSATWDGRNQNGEHMPSGVYYVRMTASATNHNGAASGTVVATRKMLMIK
jgi:hypothetical protein